MTRRANICAGPYGPVYDFWIERKWLMRAVGHLAWGIDLAPLYSTMEAISKMGDGATILDVPCGGGVAFRALRPDQEVRYIAGDLSTEMLTRAERRAEKRGLDQVEFAVADMRALPFADGVADLFLSYSGLHMVDDAEAAVSEIGRCLKPGGALIGCTLLSEGSRRQRALFAVGQRLGQFTLPHVSDLRLWLKAAGIVDPVIEPASGFAVFQGTKRIG